MSTVDPSEIEKFSRMADTWWDPHGPFKPLHVINPLRVEYVLQQVNRGTWNVERDASPTFHVSRPTLLDIGCGGGLISEPMARLGAQVTGIDASEKNIAIASIHAQKNGLAIDYRCTTAEALAQSGAQFDVVLALEIVEHVADVPAFIAACAALTRPGGTLVLSTLNRTAKAFALAIVGAEYVLRWLPRGTHDFAKFLKPSELASHLRAAEMEVADITGMVMNPLTFEWRLSAKDVSVNYLLTAKKPGVIPA